ncbi:GNAT family N-acetyltransferase [uncultured Microbacterium sp.]|uniref:GNAT family N-acetyltransferase n=1 Tax=uncultured Microbacterium sp. TaxID=191216 RepID=UPI00261F6715|nr:GNAT family N-acetyltransferase [uncultured Microbacterium sp.]
MRSIRRCRPEDRAALSDICVRTAHAGADARGMLSDDDLWGLLYALPYAERHPDLCWVVDDGEGRAIGYLVATDDTAAFEEWFRAEWWPRFARSFRKPESLPERELLASANARGSNPVPHAGRYPAHLHIDLLPEAQGEGWGRGLVETLLTDLRARGVPGLHLEMDPANTSAAGFYERLGMHPLETGPDGQAYGILL